MADDAHKTLTMKPPIHRFDTASETHSAQKIKNFSLTKLEKVRKAFLIAKRKGKGWKSMFPIVRLILKGRESIRTKSRNANEDAQVRSDRRRAKKIEKLRRAVEKEEEEERTRRQYLVRKRTNVRHSFTSYWLTRKTML